MHSFKRERKEMIKGIINAIVGGFVVSYLSVYLKFSPMAQIVTGIALTIGLLWYTIVRQDVLVEIDSHGNLKHYIHGKLVNSYDLTKCYVMSDHNKKKFKMPFVNKECNFYIQDETGYYTAVEFTALGVEQVEKLYNQTLRFSKKQEYTS